MNSTRQQAAPRSSVRHRPLRPWQRFSDALCRAAGSSGAAYTGTDGILCGRQRRSGGFSVGRLWLGVLLLLLIWWAPLGSLPAWAADLQVSEVRLEPCPAADAGSQPGQRRPSGASCYALRGEVTNPGRQPVVDTDVFALILDSSGEPVLPNRSRVGSIGDVPPGRSAFALRLAIPAGTPGPFVVRNARARGFKAPVRMRAAEGEELLPLEQAVAPD